MAKSLKNEGKQAKMMRKFVTLLSVSLIPQVKCINQSTESIQWDKATKFNTCIVRSLYFYILYL